MTIIRQFLGFLRASTKEKGKTSEGVDYEALAAAKVALLTAVYERQSNLVSHVSTASDTKASLLLVLTGVVTAGSFFDGTVSLGDAPTWSDLAGLAALFAALVTAAFSICSMWPKRGKTLYTEELVRHAETTGDSLEEFKHYELSLVRESFQNRVTHQTRRSLFLTIAFSSAAFMLVFSAVSVGMNLIPVGEGEHGGIGRAVVSSANN